MRVVEVSACVALVVAVIAASSRSDTVSTDVPSEAPAEPITGAPVTPQPGSARPHHHPFTPYEPGAPEAVVPYQSLSAAEQQVVDRRRGEDFTAIHAGFAGAVRRRATQARADAAVIQLGLEPSDLEVP